MIAHALDRRTESGHVRPFVPYRDLDNLAMLIERSFGAEIEQTGSTIVRDLRQMAMLGPLLRATGAIVTPFTGFVWIEDDQLVGNVSLSLERGADRVWTVSNVAVLPEYRQQGIASHLVDRAIEHVRRQGGRAIHLQVRTTNEVATRMYQRRGFITVDTLHELELSRFRWPISVGQPLAPVRRARLTDAAAIRHLLQTHGPKGLAPIQVLRSRGARLPSLRYALRYLLTGECYYQAVVSAKRRVVAYGCAHTTSPRGPHELALYVMPPSRGEWETSLIEWLLTRLRTGESHAVRAVISADHPEALMAAEKLGFRTTRILAQMMLYLRPSDADGESQRTPRLTGIDRCKTRVSSPGAGGR